MTPLAMREAKTIRKPAPFGVVCGVTCGVHGVWVVGCGLWGADIGVEGLEGAKR